MDLLVKKQSLRLLTYGLYVVTAGDGKDVAAGSINWLSQASFEPPLVMVAVKSEGLHPHRTQRTFAVNVLVTEECSWPFPP
jgi:flavin reductase (DIM6/NTAB) family NADH-FMN oxidoreductase RutF